MLKRNRKNRIFPALYVLLCLLTACCASGEETAFSLAGSWAFPHEPEKAVLSLEEDGAALYNGAPFAWESTGEELLLTDGDGQRTGMRWAPAGDGIIVYIPTVFDCVQRLEGIAGVWKAEGASESSFIFATDGQFLEDGVFVGTYTVDEEAGTITLDYRGLFEKTVVYYSMEGEKLTVAYPWTMIRQQ